MAIDDKQRYEYNPNEQSMSVSESLHQLKDSLESAVIGQEKLVNRMLIALLVDGHLLVEGAPGLAKTRAIKALSDNIAADYQRVQFTPDLLPADLTGTEIYRPSDGTFVFQQGPLFNNLILADEINRAPAKVQSALLEAMAEQQISVGHQTYELPALFMVMATQNPIEQEGTYPLPEAQLDRFLMHVVIDYPDASREVDILRLVRNESRERSKARISADTSAKKSNLKNKNLRRKVPRSSDSAGSGSSTSGPSNTSEVASATATLATGNLQPLPLETIFAARREVLDVHMAENVEDYIVRLVTSTRTPESHTEELRRWISYGASPRATIALDACSRAQAWLQGRDYVSPADVQAVVHDVLRHRVLLSFEAEADGVQSTDIIDRLLHLIAVP